jgi:hypothetical protein
MGELAIIAAIVVVLVISLLIPRLSRRPFDPVRWHSCSRDRWRLAHDLLRSERLRGLRSNEIVALLGNPDYASENSLAYYLTGQRFGDKLRVRLNPDGCAYKVKIELGCD